ncbi:MAG: hypothetical protein ABUL60_14875 [Myxococcales bacterium]
MALEHWKYFVALEIDLHTVARYVEPAPANMATFSVELAKLFLSAASEAEVVSRVLCAKQNLTPKTDNIEGWREALHARFPKLHAVPVSAPRFGLTFLPWADWASANTPQWWRDHNKVKHERHSHFPKASLGNALDAMAALYVLLWYLDPRHGLMRAEAFFEHENESQQIVTGTQPPPDH